MKLSFRLIVEPSEPETPTWRLIRPAAPINPDAEPETPQPVPSQ